MDGQLIGHKPTLLDVEVPKLASATSNTATLFLPHPPHTPASHLPPPTAT